MTNKTNTQNQTPFNHCIGQATTKTMETISKIAEQQNAGKMLSDEYISQTRISMNIPSSVPDEHIRESIKEQMAVVKAAFDPAIEKIIAPMQAELNETSTPEDMLNVIQKYMRQHMQMAFDEKIPLASIGVSTTFLTHLASELAEALIEQNLPQEEIAKTIHKTKSWLQSASHGPDAKQMLLQSITYPMNLLGTNHTEPFYIESFEHLALNQTMGLISDKTANLIKEQFYQHAGFPEGELTPMLLLMVMQQTSLERFNAITEMGLGYSSEQLQNMDLHSILSPEQAAIMDKTQENAVQKVRDMIEKDPELKTDMNKQLATIQRTNQVITANMSGKDSGHSH